MSEYNICDNDWEEEVSAVIRDIEQHVLTISLSTLPSSKERIYFNMTTLENKDFCVELSVEGFRIVGEKYDSDETRGKYTVFETPYSMLHSLSPAYRASFGEELYNKLTQLQKMHEESKKEDSDESA